MGSASTALSAGDIIAGRYEIEERLGEGGMAVVYQARHTGTDKRCALKFLLPQLSKADQHQDQFLREARVAGRIGSHPHIIDVFDTGTDEQRQLPFIAMELLRGLTLSDFAAAEGRISWEVAQTLLEQLGDALDSAHQAGVVHRDLKPTNIFVTQDRKGQLRLKVLDFGIAKVLEGTIGDRTATQVGTPWFSAPEQLGSSMRKLAGERGITISMGVSAATDVWALGLVAYELLSGVQSKEYWGSQTMADQMIKVALDERAPPSERAGDHGQYLPAGFDEWFLRCTRHDADERFPSAGEAVERLCRLLAAEPQTMRVPPTQDDNAATLIRPAPPGLAAEQPTTPVELPSPIAGGLAPAPPAPRPLYPSAAATGPDTPPTIASAPLLAAIPGAAGPQPDTASSWQALEPAPPTRPRTAWILIGGAALALAIGSTAAMLTFGSSMDSPGPASAETDTGTLDEELSTASAAEDPPSVEPPPDSPAGGGGGSNDAVAAPEAADSAEADELPSPRATTSPPTAVAPMPRTTSTSAPRPQTPPQGKGFDDLFGAR